MQTAAKFLARRTNVVAHALVAPSVARRVCTHDLVRPVTIFSLVPSRALSRAQPREALASGSGDVRAVHAGILVPAVLQQHNGVYRFTAALGARRACLPTPPRPCGARAFHSQAPLRQQWPPQWPPGGPAPNPGVMVAVTFAILVAFIVFGTLIFSIVITFWPLLLLGGAFFWFRRAVGGGGVPRTAAPGLSPFPPLPPGFMGGVFARLAETAARAAGTQLSQLARLQSTVLACTTRAVRESVSVRAELARFGVHGDGLHAGTPWRLTSQTIGAGGVVGALPVFPSPRSVVDVWAPVLDGSGTQVASIQLLLVPTTSTGGTPGRGGGGPSSLVPRPDGVPFSLSSEWARVRGNVSAVFGAGRSGSASPTEAYFTHSGGAEGVQEEAALSDALSFAVSRAVLTTPSGHALDVTEEFCSPAMAWVWVERAGDAAEGSGGGVPWGEWPGGPTPGPTSGQTVDLDKGSYRSVDEVEREERGRGTSKETVQQRRDRLRGLRRDE